MHMSMHKAAHPVVQIQQVLNKVTCSEAPYPSP